MSTMDDRPGINWIEIFSNQENANNILNAILALITVLAAHDIIEGLIVRSSGVLRLDSVFLLHLMRSHCSPFEMVALWRGKLFRSSRAHKLGCKCLWQYRRLIMKTMLVRVVILLIEVAAIFMAITQSWPKYIHHGAYALTLLSNNYGNITTIQPGLGCQEILKLPKFLENSPEVDRKTQFTVCTVSHNPFEPPHNLTITQPGGNYAFFLYIDLSGDKVTFSSENRTVVGSEMYAYAKSDGVTPRLVEGPIASVVDGVEYSKYRNRTFSKSENKQWKSKLDKYLRTKMKDGYHSIYEQDTLPVAHPVPRILLSFNFKKLSQKNNIHIKACEDMTSECAAVPVVQLLQQIVGIQRRVNGGSSIRYSTGTEMKASAPNAVQYTVKRPVIGSVPWILILVFVILIRSIHSYFFPNRFYTDVARILRNHPGDVEDPHNWPQDPT